MKLSIALLLAFLTLNASAEGGALSLKTEPRDAEIYVDGELKGNTTPIILKMPAGKHHIKAVAGDKQAEIDIIIPDGGLVSKLTRNYGFALQQAKEKP